MKEQWWIKPLVYGSTLALFACIVITGLVFNAYVLMRLWGWFVVPIVFGMPPLTLSQAIGMDLVVGLMTQQMISTPENERWTRPIGRLLVFNFLRPSVVLFVGWMVQGW